MNLRDLMPADWRDVVEHELAKPHIADLEEFLRRELREQTVYPPRDHIFAALRLTPFTNTRLLILGQDPYHDDGQAHGLCFSVRRGVRLPPSLRNIFRELHEDIGCPVPEHGCLESWARQGCLLLNTVLTVRAHEAHSHAGRGWERLTDAIIAALISRPEPVVFVLWGNPAKKKLKLIDSDRHTVITSAHPSPLSAYRGFFGSRPFSAVNRALVAGGQPPIDWHIPS